MDVWGQDASTLNKQNIHLDQNYDLKLYLSCKKLDLEKLIFSILTEKHKSIPFALRHPICYEGKQDGLGNKKNPSINYNFHSFSEFFFHFARIFFNKIISCILLDHFKYAKIYIKNITKKLKKQKLFFSCSEMLPHLILNQIWTENFIN